MTTVLQVIPSLVPEAGGTAQAVAKISESLAQLNNQIHLLAVDLGAKCSAPILPGKAVNTRLVPCHFSIGINPIWIPKFSSTLKELSLTKKIQIIHDNGCWLPTNYVVMKATTHSKAQLIVSPHGMLEPWAFNNRRGRKQIAWHLFQKRELQQAKVLHATSSAEAENLRRIGFTQSIAIIPNGVDLPPYQQTRQIRLNKQQRTLLFLSRIHPVKGLLNLVASLKHIDLNHWQVVIAGPNENNHLRDVEAAVISANLQDKVAFVGAVDRYKKWELYQQADLFVLPTFTENFGIVIAEALATGVPVITTKGAPWQDLETHRCGWWIDIGVEPLTQALKTAMSLTDQERTIMGNNGRKLVEQKYSWADVAEQMAAVYRWMLGEGDKPNCIWD